MNSAELDRLWQRTARKIVAAEIIGASRPMPDHPTRVMVTLDDGSRLELFASSARERALAPKDFIGLTLDEARALTAARSHAGA
jgi:hypothetical protein